MFQVEDVWETKDENLIHDIRDYGRVYEELLKQMRLHIDAGRTLAGADPETMSFVYMQPAILIYDPARHGPTGGGVPPGVITRVNFRPFKIHMHGAEEDIARIPAIMDWQRKQFREIGYLVLLLPVIDLKNVPQGRRRLDFAEGRVLATLELWAFALMPEIDRLFRATEENGARASKERYDSVEKFLAAVAPDILRAAKRSVAGRNDEQSSEDAGVIFGYLNAIQNEGRRHRISFSGESELDPLHGEALRARIKRLGTRVGSDCKIPDVVRLASYIKILNTLAKARTIVTEVMSGRVSDMTNYQWGMDRIEEVGTHNILSNKGQYSKRTQNAAFKVRSAQTPDAFVQPPRLSDHDRFSLMELATIAFLCDVDPYVFCAQHALRYPEVWIARAWGRLSFRGPEPEPHERDLGEMLESGELSVPDCKIEAHGEPSTQSVFRDLQWIAHLLDLKTYHAP